MANRIPDDYEIDDLVDAIIASRQPTLAASSTASTPRPQELSLDAIDGDDEFDVDSIVDAIVTAGKTADLRARQVVAPGPPAPAPPAPASARPWAEATPTPSPPGTPWAELTPSRLPPATGSPFRERTPFGEPTPFPPDGSVPMLVPGEPARRPPPRPSTQSFSAIPAPEAMTPPGPIDLSRVEQPTRPPVRPLEITHPGHHETDRDISSGTVIGDRYRVVDLIGRGGVSVVYRVEHTLLQKRMALKVLRPELSQTPSVVDRFHREARLVCQLDDPHIVRVTDFGRTSDGSLYLVMDFVDGESLAAKLRRETRIAPEAAIRIVLEVLAGLAHAHEFGVVHRDLKPENIMVQERAYRLTAKILDFGIAKLGDSEQGSKPITQVGTVFGTPRYMSPEQAAGEPVDRRTDVYSTGVILYELLTGRPPFDGETTVRILSKVLTQEPPPLNLVDPRPFQLQDLQAIVLRALAKEKAERYSTVQEFRAALEACPRSPAG